MLHERLHLRPTRRYQTRHHAAPLRITHRSIAGSWHARGLRDCVPRAAAAVTAKGIFVAVALTGLFIVVMESLRWWKLRCCGHW